MEKKYLYLDKKQRIHIEGKYSKRATRIMEELDKLEVDHDFYYFDDVGVQFTDKGTKISVGEKDILSYSNILFGGHFLNSNGYEIKRMIVDVVDEWNSEYPKEEIKVQNSKFIKKLPFYSKLSMAKICQDAGLPHLTTYYEMSGDYRNNRGPIDYPLIAKHVLGDNDLVKIDGKNKIKKNVYLVEKESDWDQERLAKKDLSDFLIQEFTETGEDIRIFVSNGEVVGGWKRVSPEDNFMTVTKGAQYYYYNDPSEEIRQICINAAKAWEVDFMALDFIYKDGKPHILEFSMNPGFNAYENKCLAGRAVNIGQYIVTSFGEN